MATGEHNGYGPLAVMCLRGFEDRAKMVEKWIGEKTGNKKEKYILDINQVRFSNGEAKLQVKESVRGKDVFILADIGNYSCTYKMFGSDNRMSPDDHFQDIKRAISAMNGRAKRITVVMPLLYASRQHRRMSRESLDCAIALQELVALGATNILSFDIHAPDIQNAIPTTTFDNILPSFAILEKFIEEKGEKVHKDDMIVIAPDTGATDRAKSYANMLGLDMGLTYKRRDYSVIVNGTNPVIEFAYLGRNVKGKTCVIVDDMIASGGTILDVAKELKDKGAKDVCIITSFALFNEGCAEFDRLHKEGIISKVFSTNLSYVPEHIRKSPWFIEVDLTPFIARVMVTLNRSESMTQVIDSRERIAGLLSKWKEKKKS